MDSTLPPNETLASASNFSRAILGLDRAALIPPTRASAESIATVFTPASVSEEVLSRDTSNPMPLTSRSSMLDPSTSTSMFPMLRLTEKSMSRIPATDFARSSMLPYML